MVFKWASRCLPGFSIIALIVLLRLTSSDAVAFWKWKGSSPSSPKDQPGSQPHPLNMAQHLFVVYTVLVHVSMFAFTTRLAWAIFSATWKTKEVLQRRKVEHPRVSVDKDKWLSDTSTLTDTDSDVSDPLMSDAAHDSDGLEVIHAIIVPNYCEDLHTLRTTLDVLASHPRARTQYEVGAERDFLCFLQLILDSGESDIPRNGAERSWSRRESCQAGICIRTVLPPYPCYLPPCRFTWRNSRKEFKRGLCSPTHYGSPQGRAGLGTLRCDCYGHGWWVLSLLSAQFIALTGLQPIRISGRTTLQRSGAFIMRTSRKQIGLCIAALSFSTAILTRPQLWSVAQTYFGDSPVCPPCTPGRASQYRRQYTLCRCLWLRGLVAGTVIRLRSERTCI